MRGLVMRVRQGNLVRARLVERSGLWDELGEENIHGNLDDALNRARQHLGLPQVPRPAFAMPTVARER